MGSLLVLKRTRNLPDPRSGVKRRERDLRVGCGIGSATGRDACAKIALLALGAGDVPRETAAERAAIESRRVERVYSVLARIYDDSFDWALGPGRRRAVQRLAALPRDRVLEVGVGTGLSLPHYPSGCRVTAIDISGPMLEQARERARALAGLEVDLRRMDARELQFPDATFDRVLAPYVISVVPEPARVMAEIARVCKPGATVIVVNHFLSPRPPLRWFERWLTPISQWIGFRLDLPLATVSRTPGLRVVGVERVNLFGLWQLLDLRAEPAHGSMVGEVGLPALGRHGA
jgi:phosphatidylethanolamine/phosphatidyl-N-methylethanolamine N-methyltransferase